jgi:hypothetical protein
MNRGDAEDAEIVKGKREKNGFGRKLFTRKIDVHY